MSLNNFNISSPIPFNKFYGLIEENSKIKKYLNSSLQSTLKFQIFVIITNNNILRNYTLFNFIKNNIIYYIKHYTNINKISYSNLSFNHNLIKCDFYNKKNVILLSFFIFDSTNKDFNLIRSVINKNKLLFTLTSSENSSSTS